MTNKQVEEIVREGKKEVEEYYSHRLAMHEGRGYMHTVVNMEVFEKWLITALAEREKEILATLENEVEGMELRDFYATTGSLVAKKDILNTINKLKEKEL